MEFGGKISSAFCFQNQKKNTCLLNVEYCCWKIERDKDTNRERKKKRMKERKKEIDRTKDNVD